MATEPPWPPALIEFAVAQNDWNRYCDLLYGEFHRDFIGSRTEFLGKRVTVNPSRSVQGKAQTFWHCISEGPVEDERLTDFRRCERIRWPSQLIQSAGTDRVRWWRERRGSSRRTHIALPDFSYVVVLEELTTHCVLVTAYPVSRAHSREQLQDRYGRASEKG